MYPGDDPQRRIADLERELAEQKRINALQNQLADARAIPRRSGGAVRIGNLVAGGLGFLGFCSGMGAALIAMFPSSALWMSPVICGASDQLMVNTSHYSYKPNQSGTTVDFQCLKADGAYHANWLAISALQAVLVAVILAGVAAVVFVVRRRMRGDHVSGLMTVSAGALGVIAAATVGFFVAQTFSGGATATQLPEGGNLTIDGNGDTKTIACNDGHVTVDGREMTVRITGHCASLSVDGVIHHITVDSVDTIEVDGLQNVVTYHEGSPKVTMHSNQNTVQHN